MQVADTSQHSLAIAAESGLFSGMSSHPKRASACRSASPNGSCRLSLLLTPKGRCHTRVRIRVIRVFLRFSITRYYCSNTIVRLTSRRPLHPLPQHLRHDSALAIFGYCVRATAALDGPHAPHLDISRLRVFVLLLFLAAKLARNTSRRIRKPLRCLHLRQSV